MDDTGQGGVEPSAWLVEWRCGGDVRRAVLTSRLRLGRSPTTDVVIEDPYVSREHCVLESIPEGVRVDASGSLNRIRVEGRDVEQVILGQAGAFVIGQTTIQVRPLLPSEDSTLHLGCVAPVLTLRRSTRELTGADGAVVARLSALEAAALEHIARSYPDATDHEALGRAIWGEGGYDRYLIHRIVQRVRERLGCHADLIENVRGSGYRLRSPIDVR